MENFTIYQIFSNRTKDNPSSWAVASYDGYLRSKNDIVVILYYILFTELLKSYVFTLKTFINPHLMQPPAPAKNTAYLCSHSSRSAPEINCTCGTFFLSLLSKAQVCISKVKKKISCKSQSYSPTIIN